MLFLKELREQGITGELVKQIYDANQPTLSALREKYERYMATALPIHNREYGGADSPVIESKINNDYFGEIVDMKVGHFAGKAASYGYDKTRGEYQSAYDVLSRFHVVNNLAHIDVQTTKDAAICGCAYRLLYINPEQELRVMTLRPYEVVTIYENEPAETEFAFRFYPVEQAEGEPKIYADAYDGSRMFEFELADKGFVKRGDGEERLHLFDYCPVIKYLNNDEEQGDVDKVLSLIDAYDRTLSDMNAEITSFRLAYLKIIGGQIEKDVVTEGRKIGAFMLPDGVDMEFLLKNLPDEPVVKHLETLQENIYQFSKTPNLRDVNFGQNSSGVAMRYKLSNIEAKCLTFENIKVHSDIRQFKIAATWWKKKEQVELDPYSVIITHHRNVPIDLNEVAEAIGKLVAFLPLEILLPEIPFIDDPEYVLEIIRQKELEAVANNERLTVPRTLEENLGDANEEI